jgi:AcrR family transcriptional regulator
VARPKLHDETLRLRLLEAAAEVVADSGESALSLRRVAAEAGTSTTAVYSLFGNKTGLLENLYREAMRRFAARLATVGPTDDPAGDILRLGLAYRDYALTEPHLYSVMFARRPDEWDPTGVADEEAAETLRPLTDAVRRGQAAGTFAAGPPERIALSCWGIAHGLVSLELTGVVPGGLQVADGYADALRAMITGWSA